MKKIKFLEQSRWLMVIMMLITFGVNQVWAGDPTLADLSFSTSGSVRIINEDFGSCSTFSRTAKVANSVEQDEYGVFNYLYNNNTSNSYGISDTEATTGFATNCLAQSAGSGSPVMAFIDGTTFGSVGAWRLKTTKTSYNQFGIYSIKDNNGLTHANARVHIQNNQGAISISSGSSWTTVKTVTTDIVDICVIYNKSGSSKTYGSSISISNNRAHVYINGDCVMNGDNPKEFSISSTAIDANCVFKVLPQWTSGNKSYVDDVQVWNALPTAGSCTAPSSVTVDATSEAGNYGWRYSTGQTIKLTASASGGSGGSYTYQWQKYVGSDWENLTNGGSISGATSANLVISNCTSSNGGSYRCAVSTGATCTTNSDGYFVRVFTFNGNYSGSGFSENAITWTGENTGTVTLSLTESSIYEFKVYDNDGKIFGNGANNYIVQPVSWDCGTGNSNCRLFTGPAGNYTFTLNISHAGDNSPYVNVQVAYPTVTHPVEGYAYVSKWWDCYVHWWYNDGSDHALTSWGSDPQITTYADVCGTNYWYFPVLHTYNKLIVKNNAGDATSGNTSGDQTTDSHSGKYLTHDGVSWGWHDFTFYEIDFDGNGSDGGSMTDVAGICPNDSRTLATNNYSRTGYTFTGWNTQAGGGGTSYANLATISSINADIDLYAQWSAKTISITLDKNNNDASGSTSGSTSIKYDATAVLSSPTHATRTGYTLEGYYAESGCTNKVMTNAGVLVNYSGYVESGKWVRDVTPTTLYAKWTPIPYTVTWYVEGTELTGLAAGLTTVNYGSKVTGLPSTPVSTCDGTFMGWTTSADAVYDKNVTDNYTTTPTVFTTQAGSPTITGDITFYAVFKKRMED